MKETKTSAEKVVKDPKPKLMNIKLEKLHPFRSHPYKVFDDESMTELVESIKEYGQLNRISSARLRINSMNTKLYPDTAECVPPSFLK